MAIIYSLQSFSLQDANGYAIAAQASEPLSITLGDAKVLLLELDRFSGLGFFGSLPLVSETLYFNPALLIADGVPFSPVGGVPAFGYKFSMPQTGGDVPLFAETNMEFFGASQPQKNIQATIERDSFSSVKIRLYFNVLSDLDGFIDGAAIDNALRLFQDEVSTKNIGAYLLSDAVESDGIGVYSTGDKLIITDGRSWNPGTTSITITGSSPINGTYTVDSVSTTSITNDTANINVGTPIPFTGTFSGLTATPDIGVPLAFKSTVTASKTPVTLYLQANLLTEGDTGNTMTSPTLSLKRGVFSVSDLSSVESTTGTFGISSAGVVSKARLWVQNLNAVQNEVPFKSDAAYVVDLSGGITSPAAGQYETVYIFPALASGGLYRVLIVWYDEGGDIINSFGYQLETTDEQTETAYPDIQSKIEDYIHEFGDYVKAPVYDRLRLSVFLDKSTYNLRSLTGNFDDNFKRFELRVLQDGSQVQIFNSETLPASFTVSDSPTNYNAAYSLRIEKAWDGSQITFQWYFHFDNGIQADRIGFVQKLDVHSEAKNLIGATIYDNSGSFLPANILANFCEDLNQIATVRTESMGDNYAQMAVLVLPTIQEEETYNTGILLPQLSADNLQEVDAEWTGGFAVAKIDIEGIRPDAAVILSKELTEAVSLSETVNLTQEFI